MNSKKPTLWTTAPTFTKTPSSVHPVYRPCLNFWVHCTDVFNFPNIGSTGETKIPGVLQVNAPTYVIFSASVQPVILKYLCLDFFDLDFFTVSSILVLWTEEVSGRCPETREGRLPLDHRRGGPSGLATHIFSLSSLEPKNLKMIILIIILVQVLCCLYQSPKHYIKI